MDLLINENNELQLTNGDVALTVPGVETVAQRILLRLSLFLGEWFLNTDEGTAWREQILVKPVNLSIVRAIIGVRITTCPGVVSLDTLELDLDVATRKLTFDFVAVISDNTVGLEGIDGIIEAGGALALDDPELLMVTHMTGGFL